MNEKDTKPFSYTYSAREQEEMKNIRKKYLPREEDKMALLRRLDTSVYRKATTVSLVIGIIGALILGLGMSMCMVWTNALLLPGIIIGVAGIALVSLAYPAYNEVIKRERRRIAPEILRLTDELMK